MALFFDGEWFDAQLKTSHLSRVDIARALGVSEIAVAEIWKDQRELSAHDVSTFAVLLAVAPEEIAKRAGVSTPVPKSQPDIADLAARLEKVEAELAHLKARIEGKAP